MGVSETESSNRFQLRDEALCRSVIYGALALGLHYPTDETLQRLRSEDARLALPDAASRLSGASVASSLRAGPPSDPSLTLRAQPSELPVDEGASIDLAARVAAWMETFEALTLERLISAHSHLFGHTARSAVCPYEAEYGQEALFQQPRQLAEISGFYRAFGLATRAQERERADHASCELEFLDFLCRKEAFALETGDDAMLAETRKAIRLFLRDHLGRFGRAFAASLRRHDGAGFFGRAGDLLSDFVTLECRRVRVQPGPALLHLRSAEDDKVPMACDSRPDLVQLEVPE